jgi:hypothetical protein
MENDAMLCWWIVPKIWLQPQWNTCVELVLLGLCWVATQGHTPGYQPRICVVVFTWGCTCGRPPRNKEVIMSSMFRVLPVQPYDIMGSVLIEYDVRVQLVAWHRWYLGTGLACMVEFSFWKVLSHSIWVEWVLRWKYTTPAGCKTNRLAVSPVMDNLSL